MQNDKTNPLPSLLVPSVEQTTAVLEKEETEQDAQMQGSPPTGVESAAFIASMQQKSSIDESSRGTSSVEQQVGQDGRYLFNQTGTVFPMDTHETDARAKKVLTDLQREQQSRLQNPSLLVDDLKELGMYGELSDDNGYINMPFEDVHRLVMTMKMAELILNDRVHSNRKDKMAQIKAQLDADCGHNTAALLAEFHKAKHALTQKHSFRSVGAFEPDAYNLEGLIIFESMMLARAIDWIALLSIDPAAEIRRGTIAVFSELQSAYTSQRTLHELYFHQHDDKKLLEERVRGAMSDVGERLTRVAVNPSGGVIQKRHNIATELQSVSALVEEMLSMAKQSYGAALTASHMGHLALEHTVTIVQLRQRIADLQDEISSWVKRSSKDSTAAMILAEENVVLAKVNSDLYARMQDLQERHRKQTEILSGLLASSDFGLSTTVLPDALPEGRALLDLLDLPGVYSKLIGGIREPVANSKGLLSILAPATVATRGELVESIERQLSRPFGPDLNVANSFLNVAQTRANEALRRGLTVYGEGRIPKRGLEVLFGCEPSALRDSLPPCLKAPRPIASSDTEGLLQDLQNRGSIVFCDRFFDANGNQIQDMQVAKDPLPATVLMVNAMNTSDVLSDLLRQGDIPRLLNQEIKERRPHKKPAEPPPKVVASSSGKTTARLGVGSSTNSFFVDLDSSDPRLEPSRGEKRKDGHNSTPSPSTTLAQGLSPMLDGDVLHPFCQQSVAWDDLWLEQDHGSDLRVFVNGLRDRLNNEADVQAVSEVGNFIMLLKKNTRAFQHKVDWKNPSSRVRTVIDRASRATAPIVASTPARKQGKQPRRSSAGIGRDLPEPLPGLAVEWNVEANSSWVWSDNQEGAAKSDPELLARLLQQSGWLHDKSDYLAEGKKVIPSDVMASTYKKSLAARSSSFTVQKSGKGKGKAGKFKAKWLPQDAQRVPEEAEFDLLMLPHPSLVNRDEETYVVLGHNVQVRVTKENWSTLRFNTKSWNAEYFPSSYLPPVPTILSETGDASTAVFPRSTITGTVEDFRALLLAPVLSKTTKIQPDVYRGLSLDGSSGADRSSDKATATKRIWAFLKLCAKFIPCEHETYDLAVGCLDAEVDDDVVEARKILKYVQETCFAAIMQAQRKSVSVLLQVLYFLQQGHVQFLMGDYRARVLDAHGADAFPKAPRPGTVDVVHVRDIRPSAPNNEQEEVDMTREDGEESEDSKDSGSSLIYTSGGEEDKANTPVPSAPQMKASRSQKGTSMPSETTEAAGFGSDTSSRKEAGDNDELGQAGPN